MICRLKKKRIEEIGPSNIFVQTPFWARIKSRLGYDALGFELTVSKDLLHGKANSGEKVSDDLVVLIRYIDHRHCLAYVPYGPELEPDPENQGVLLEQLSQTIKPLLPPECIFIRFDLQWQNLWAMENDFFDLSGNWKGPPRRQIQEIRINCNTSTGNLKKSPGDFLPTDTFFINLNLKEKDLLNKMRYNTRYNVKRAANRGVIVKEYGKKGIPEWYRMYHATALRHRMPLQNKDYFENVMENQDRNEKGVKVKMLMAEKGGKPLAALFLVLSKKRGTYLYGASSTQNKQLGASYALQWEAIKTAKKWGCTEYDMFGSAPNLNPQHPLHGVHIYKKGFGGILVHRMGCWDYPYQYEKYESYRNWELNNT